MQRRRFAPGRYRRLTAATAAMAAVLIATGTIALASPVNELVGPSWRNVYRATVPGNAAFTDVVAIGRSDAWAVGERYNSANAPTGAILSHWNGIRWRQAGLPVRDFVAETVTATSAKNVWILGFVIPPPNEPVTAGIVLHLVDGKWRPVPLPPEPANYWNEAPAMQGVAVAFRGGQVWLSGGLQTAPGGGLETQIWQWTGSNWAGTTVPGLLTSLSGSSIFNIWATTVTSLQGTGPTHAYKFISATWTRQKATPVLDDANITVHSPGDIWLAGLTARQSHGGLYSTVEHWNGARWRGFTVVAAGGYRPTVADARGGAWIGPMLHEVSGRWYQPASGWIWGVGCEPLGFAGNIGTIPGTSASWAAGGCTPRGQHHGEPSISINGKL
jgi:hypothetical protein